MQDNYDFIIVGGGPAGCVLARRLVDQGNVSVLLLESGPSDWNPLIHMPAGFAKLTGLTYSWGYETSAQKGLNGKEVWYPQGRVLGGSSSINAQIYTRGNAWDYDNWAANGCDGWSYKDILPYFIKSENNNRYDDDYHGQDGPLKVSDAIPHEMTTLFARAAQQAGIPFNPDFNGATQEGIGYYQVTNRNGKRSSASVCFLQKIKSNERLTIKTKAHVEKIIVSNGRATGVVTNGRTIKVNKEVLLTAGAIGSPRLLLHSGIGPAKHLQSVGVDVVCDVPYVGENLHDHMDVFIVSECLGSYSFDRYKPWYMSMAAGLQYLLFGTGIICSNICDGGGFWYANEQQEIPDTQFHFLPGTGLEHGLKPIKNGVTLNSAWLRPKARGAVRLLSNNPLDKVYINPNYWGHPEDIAQSIASFKLARRIMQQKAFANFIKDESAPGREVKTDEDIKQYAWKHAKTDYHPVGTCKMGAKEDKTAVVNTRLQLKNIENLRVCDSSVMPFVPSCNTNAPTMMVAEKGADMIIADHNL